MAEIINIATLNTKKEDGGSSNQGVLRADEFNALVNAVIKNKSDLESVVKGVKIGVNEYLPNSTNNGVIDITAGLSGDNYSISINKLNGKETPKVIKKGDSCMVYFTITHKKKDGSVFNAPCTAYIKLNGALVDTVKNIYDQSLTTTGSSMKTLFEYDLMKTNKLTTSTEGNICEIEVRNDYGAFDVFTASILVVDGAVTISLNNGLSGYNVYDNTTNLALTVHSTHAGNLTLDINGQKIKSTISTSQDPIFDIKENYLTYVKNGLNKITAAVELRDDKYKLTEDIVETEDDESTYFHIYSSELTFIYSTSTVVPTVMINVLDNQTNFDEYSTVRGDFIVYKPEGIAASTAFVKLWKLDDKDNKVDLIGEPKSQELVFTGKVCQTSLSIMLFATDGHLSGNYAIEVVFEYGSAENALSVSDLYKINIKKSDVDLVANNNYAVYLSSYNKSNSDIHREEWENGPHSIYSSIKGKNLLTIDPNTPLEFTETGSGWNSPNNDGIVALSLKRGKFITINYAPFDKKFIHHDSTNGVKGKTISFEFTTKNCIDQTQSIITCLSEIAGKEVGFDIKVNEVNLYSQNAKANVKFKEEEKVRVDIVIEGKYSTYVSTSVVGDGADPNDWKKDETQEALMIIYINGVYQRLVLFNLTLDNFNQNINSDNYIRIGSTGCDIDLYTIRIYEDALDSRAIINNYSYDTPNPEDRIKLRIENDIFVDNSVDENGRPLIDIGKLNKARPELPIWTSMMKNTTGELPNNKTTWMPLLEMKYENPFLKTSDDYDKGGVSWEADMGVLRNQGTSSMNYPMPWRNWDFKLDDAVNGGEGKSKKFYIPSKIDTKVRKESSWIQYKDMPGGIKKITLKKDYASSEMCNNAVCSSIYTDMALGISTNKSYTDVVYDLMRPVAYVDEKGNSLYRHTGFRFSFVPINCVMFNKHNNEANFMESLGMMNLIPNKNEVKYLGMDINVETKDKDGNVLSSIQHAWNNGGKSCTIETYCDDEGVDRTQSWEISENHILWNQKLETFFCSADTPVQGSDGKSYGSKSGYPILTTKAAIEEFSKNKAIYIGSKDKNKLTSTDRGYWKVAYETNKDTNLEERADKYLGNVFNGIDGNYEARYPKDSAGNGPTLWGGTKDQPVEADFGFAPSGDLDDAKYTCMYNEHKDILDFHNWLYSVNLGYATDKPLTDDEKQQEWNIAADGSFKETKDTIAYRKAKFAAEAESRMIINQWILYYIWRETFWMFDSGAKNLQIYSFGPATDANGKKYPYMQWGCMVRDADTALGIDNIGVELFPAHIEDVDYYTLKNNEAKFYYNGAEKCYSTEDLARIHSELLKRPESIYYEEVGEGEGDYIYEDGIYKQVDEGTGNFIKLNKHESVAKMVLNGQFGSAWINIREAYGNRGGKIATMYSALRKNASETHFSYNEAYKLFDAHQDKWCKALYNYGMRQYYGGSLFTNQIKSGNGDKKLSRRAWLEKAFYYRDTKYDALGNGFSFRGEEVRPSNLPLEEQGTVTIKTYSPQYIATGSTDQTMVKAPNRFRITDIVNGINITTQDLGIEAGGSIENEMNENQGAVATDKNVYLFGVENITDLGDLSKSIKFQNIKFAAPMDKLLSFRLGNKDKYWKDSNNQPIKNGLLSSLNCNTLKKLTEIDVTNHTALTTLEINQCLQLEKLYAEGTDSLTALELPQTSTLKEIRLGRSLQSLKLINLTGVQDLQCGNYANIKDLEITNCSDYINSESYNIFKQSFNSLKAYYDDSHVQNCKINNVNWKYTDTGVTVNDLLDLASINADIKGTVQLSTMSFAEKMTLRSIFGNIDTNNPKEGLRVEVISFVKLTSVTINPELSYAGIVGNTYELSFTPSNTQANSVYEVEWGFESNGTIPQDDIFKYVEFVNTKGNLVFKRIGNSIPEPADGAAKPSILAKVKLYCYKDNSKDEIEIIEGSAEVRLYDRQAKLGDIVYHDGTTSSVNEVERNKIPIGVCFYIDEDDPTLRLMVSLKNIEDTTISNANGADVTIFPWGPVGASEITLLNTTNFTDIEAITNWADKDILKSDIKTYRNLRDATNTDWVYDDSKYFNQPNPQKGFGELGFKTITNPVFFESVSMSDNNFVLPEKLPYGKYNTLSIISTRNKVLTDAAFAAEPYITIPETVCNANGNEVMFEYKYLENCIINAQEQFIKKDFHNIAHVFYSPASYCYGYAPYLQTATMPQLDSKFKVHNWFLPSVGEMLRLGYFVNAYKKPSTDNEEFNIFKPLYELSYNDAIDPDMRESIYRFEFDDFLSNSRYLTSSEGIVQSTVQEVISILFPSSTSNTTDIQVAGYSKIATTLRVLRPICMF